MFAVSHSHTSITLIRPAGFPDVVAALRHCDAASVPNIGPEILGSCHQRIPCAGAKSSLVLKQFFSVRGTRDRELPASRACAERNGTRAVEKAADLHLRPGVGTPDPAHDLAAS